MRSEIIRDRLVIGIRDQQLSKRLQMEPELTLAKVEKLTRQRAVIAQQQQSLRAPAETKLQLESMSSEPRVTNPNRRPAARTDLANDKKP